MKRKIGLCLVIMGGLGLTYQLAMLALCYVPKGIASYLVLSLGLVLGIGLLAWSWHDSMTHKINTR